MKTLFTTSDISEKLQQKLDNCHDLNSKIVAQMHAGIAHFFFVKKDGSVREAYGTLNPDILSTFLGSNPDVTPTEPVPNTEQVYQRFYDLSVTAEPKKRWKMYDISNLVCLF